MTDLRVTKISGLEQIEKHQPETKRYYFKKEIPKEVLEQRERFKRLLSGGEVQKLMPKFKLQEGQNIFRLCRYFGPGKAGTITSSKSPPKDKQAKDASPKKTVNLKEPPKARDDSSEDSDCHESIEVLKRQAFLSQKRKIKSGPYMVFDETEELTKE